MIALIGLRNGIQAGLRNFPSHVRKASIFLAKTTYAIATTEYFLPKMIRNEIAQCANLHINDVDKQFPYQRWETTRTSGALFPRTCHIVCTTEANTGEIAAGIINNMIDCWARISRFKQEAQNQQQYHKQNLLINPNPDTCLEVCNRPESIFLGLMACSLFNSVIDLHLKRAFRGAPNASRLRFAASVITGLCLTGGLLTGAGASIPQAIAIYAIFRGTCEVSRLMTEYSWQQRGFQVIQAL
jgi:hypothetical protein